MKKKIFGILIGVLLFSLLFSGCGASYTETEVAAMIAAAVATAEVPTTHQGTSSAVMTTAAPTTKAVTSTTTSASVTQAITTAVARDNTTTSPVINTKAVNDSEWKEFLRAYEEWVDDYIEILKKYHDDPTDLTILSDYMESLEKITVWSEQADKIQSDLSGDELSEYLMTMTRIIQKLSQIN